MDLHIVLLCFCGLFSVCHGYNDSSCMPDGSEGALTTKNYGIDQDCFVMGQLYGPTLTVTLKKGYTAPAKSLVTISCFEHPDKYYIASTYADNSFSTGPQEYKSFAHIMFDKDQPVLSGCREVIVEISLSGKAGDLLACKRIQNCLRGYQVYDKNV